VAAASKSAPADWLERLQVRVESLPDGLRAHVYRARDVALELAGRHHIDLGRTETAMLAHDVCRATPGGQLLELAEDYGIAVGDLERRAPVLLHGPVGAESLSRDDGIDDAELLEAVRWHSTGHPNLGALGKLVFIADKLDPRKIAAYPYQPELRRMAEEDLAQAVVEFLSREAAGRLQRREPVHPLSIETINELLLEASSPKV
jgi:predicted HD superfamily hydrolase involved in NAD metabolism